MNSRFRLIAVALVVSIGFLFSGDDAAFAAKKWQAQYWNNKKLKGAADFEREESNIDHDWGDGRPFKGLPKDGFSARWKRNQSFDEDGLYRFTATFDDGMRVWVDGKKIIDDWDEGGVRTVEADIYLDKGKYLIKVEYYEDEGDAVAILDWARVDSEAAGSSGSGNWQAQYFNNRTLSGSPALERGESGVNQDWGGGSPAPGVVNQDDFSVRWTRTRSFDGDTYRFSATSDDGIRVWVDDRLVIDQWYDHGVRTFTADVSLTAGTHTVKVEYYEAALSAVARLTIEKASGAAPAPEAPSGAGTYTVQAGDSLGRIAARNGTTVQTLIDLNAGTYPGLRTNPGLIHVGWMLRLPGATQPPASTSVDGSGGGGGTGGGGTYTVQRGDSLGKISRQTGVPVEQLINLNSATYPSLLTNPDVIYTGWVLRLV